MSEENLNEIPEEIDEPMSANELFANLTQDAVLNADVNNVATEFIDEFVLRDRPEETSQILAMLEMPAENLVQMFKDLLGQSYQTQLQAVDNHGLQYFENLKAAVKAQMLELAN
jgi:hypothetical protein